MRPIVLWLRYALALAVSVSVSMPGWLCGDVVNFQVEQSSSNVLVLVTVSDGQGDSQIDLSVPSLSGSVAIRLDDLGPNFGLAEIQALNLTLADDMGLMFNFASSPAISLRSNAGEASIDLVRYGAAEDVGGGVIIQFGNELRNYGRFLFDGQGFDNDPLDFDVLVNQDFIGYQISRSGDLLSVRGDFYFDWNFTKGDVAGNVQWQGTFLAFAAVPEPSLNIVLGGLTMLVVGRSRMRRPFC